MSRCGTIFDFIQTNPAGWAELMTFIFAWKLRKFAWTSGRSTPIVIVSPKTVSAIAVSNVENNRSSKGYKYKGTSHKVTNSV